jgi:hypothetical protein
VHRGIDGLVPADRYFGAACEVARTLRERVAANALELARHGETRPPFYVTGQVDGQSFSVHAEGPRLILTRPGQVRQPVEMAGPAGGPPETVADSDDADSEARTAPLPTPVCPSVSAADDTLAATPDETLPADAPSGGDA